MVNRRLGPHTWAFRQPPHLAATAAVVGPLEGEGPLRATFDRVRDDDLVGQPSFELAESALVRDSVELALHKAHVSFADVDLVAGGDLLNQLVANHLAARHWPTAFLDLYGACSTWAEGLAVTAALVDAGFARRAVAVCSSHYGASERQYRYPVEHANQRRQTAQRTVTGAAAGVVGSEGPVRVTAATIGRVWDLGLKDPNDMGSAMAPAAADTVLRHLSATGTTVADYDRIITGDLARVGHPIFLHLLAEQGVVAAPVADDCGILIYDPSQGVEAGGSGCACSGTVVAGYVHQRLVRGDWRRVLVVATGALHSPTTFQQGESMPVVAHAVCLERDDGAGS